MTRLLAREPDRVYRDVDDSGAFAAVLILAACLVAALLGISCITLPKPPVVTPTAPAEHSVGITVQDQAGQPIAGAAVRLDATAAPFVGTTDAAGYVLFARVPTALRQSHLDVTADGFLAYSQTQALTAVQQTIVVTLTAAQPPPAPVDPLDVRANFCALSDPATGRPIFTSEWVHQDAATRARWLQVAREAGDTHYVIGLHGGGYGGIYETTPGFYPDRILEAVALIRELLDAQFVPVIFLHTGGTFPAEGASYFTRFIAGIPRDLYRKCIWVPGWEVVPGDWTTKQLVDATKAIREALGGDALAGPWMALHLGDNRLSFSSHPVEPDDPWLVWNADAQAWESDEIASWRSWYGQQYRFFFYQSAVLRQDDPLDDRVPASTWERAHEVLTRIVGDRWQGGPDWFAGLPVRPIPVYFEANEELYIRGRDTRARLLEISAAAMKMGWKGYGFGQAAPR